MRRSQRTESVLTFFAQDGASRNLVYADATFTKANQADQALAFARHWEAATGALPELLVFDAKVTNGAGLGATDAAGIRFLTVRHRNPVLITRLKALPDVAWTTVTLDRRGPHARPQVHEDVVTVRGCSTPLRQIAVRGLGHDEPTLILTNETAAPAGRLVNRYAKRMAIEQRLSESIRSFHLDALSSAVALNVDLDTTLTVWAPGRLRHTAPSPDGGTRPPPPTPSGVASSPPQATSPSARTRCWSGCAAAPTARSCAPPTTPSSRSPGGAADPSAASSPDLVRHPDIRVEIRCSRIQADGFADV